MSDPLQKMECVTAPTCKSFGKERDGEMYSDIKAESCEESFTEVLLLGKLKKIE